MNSIIVDLVISPQEYQRLYTEAIRTVSARTRDGRSIQFPINALKPFVGHEGIQGSFKINFDKNNRLLNCQKL